jgi:hypothetical protein
MSPTVYAPIRWASLEGQRRLTRHFAAVDRGGIILGRPWAALVEGANAFGERVRAAYHAAHGLPDHHRDREGGNRAKQNAKGQIGAVLLATFLRTTAAWNDSGYEDPGWDMQVEARTDWTLTLDAKTKQGFLLIDRPKLATASCDYYALVQQRDATSPYIFCGVITPGQYARRGFDYQLDRDRVTWAVGADQLTFSAVAFYTTVLGRAWP